MKQGELVKEIARVRKQTEKASCPKDDLFIKIQGVLQGCALCWCKCR